MLNNIMTFNTISMPTNWFLSFFFCNASLLLNSWRGFAHLQYLQRQGACWFQQKGSSVCAVAMVERLAQTLRLVAKLPLNFAASGKYLGVRWACCFQSAAKLLNLFEARGRGSRCNRRSGRASLLGHEHWLTEPTVTVKKSSNLIALNSPLLIKIILTRPPGNVLSHCKLISRLLLPSLYFITFSKMVLFFLRRWDPGFFPDLDNSAVEKGDKTSFFSSYHTKDVSQDIYSKHWIQMRGLPFPGSVFFGRNQLHQWAQEWMLKWFNQSWKSQYRKGLQFFWLDTTYSIWDTLRNFTDTRHISSSPSSVNMAGGSTIWIWFSKALKHMLSINFFN